jgi:hypothetical protein
MSDNGSFYTCLLASVTADVVPGEFVRLYSFEITRIVTGQFERTLRALIKLRTSERSETGRF